MNLDDLPSQKAQLRKSLGAWRSQFAVHLAQHPAQRLEMQRNFETQLKAICVEMSVRRLASYMPFGGEPDVSSFNSWAMQQGIDLLLPVINADNTLHWVLFDGFNTKKSSYGFAEPHGPATSLAPVDLIVVPALAIDRQGNRLGKGKGFYDRALQQNTAPLVAVVYEHELLELLPAEPHDQPINRVVTPSQTIQF